ncbi:MAG: CDP-alcohol phosphatidyltransferase family protein [Actinomycetota bacterium]|nr:CDP-alcohol phosphatidyltransferase family protein [Actinomycetota bacterium]
MLTVPNELSALRLAGVPLFLYWVLVTEQDGRAILLLMAAGASDYFDGKIARRYGQFSRLGQLLDPAADRLYILATLIALVARDGLPLWWALALIGRDAFLACFFPVLRRHGFGPPPVHFLGKAATFNLLYAFPMLLAALPERDDVLSTVFRPLGWAFATWGSTLYWWAGVLYVVQVRRMLRTARAEEATSQRSLPAERDASSLSPLVQRGDRPSQAAPSQAAPSQAGEPR